MNQTTVRPAAKHSHEVVVTSFGYLHGPPGDADIVVDVRGHFRDPHVNSRLRELTGHDHDVWVNVLNMPGAFDLIAGITLAASALLHPARITDRLIRIAIGCAGGRHRSVVLAESIADRLTTEGWRSKTEHRDVGKPVVHR